MDFKQIVKWSITVLAVLAFQYSRADEPPVPGDIYTVTAEDSESMSEHVAYLALMQNLRIAEANQGRGSSVALIQERLPLATSEANEFLDYVLDAYTELASTNRTISNRMLCQDGRPKYDPNSAFPVLTVLNDIKKTNLRRYYQRALVRVGSSAETELASWIDNIRDGNSDNRVDQAHFEYTEPTVEEIVADACTQLVAVGSQN